jgi:parallel beta-helix repeat protein
MLSPWTFVREPSGGLRPRAGLLDAQCMPRNPRLGLAVAAAAVAAATISGAPTSSAAGVCDRVASPGPGAAQDLVSSLSPGETGCLRAGLYEGNVKVSRPGITLTRYADEKATVKGRFWIARGADEVTVEGLYLDGTNPNILPSPTVNADSATFRRNDVTNYNHSICFSLGHPDWGRADDTTIEFNRIHNCGRLPATNHDHGIYVTTATDTLIRGNWIYDNADRGIQLYPDAQNTTITGNVIDGNGQGIIFSGEGGVASNGNVVEGNVITNSRLRNNVESWYPPGNPIGRNNVVRNNCVRGGAYDDGDGGIGDQRGFRVVEAVRTKPAFASRSSKDFRLAPGTVCRGLLAYRTSVPGPNGLRNAPSTRAQRRPPHVILGAMRPQVRRGQRLRLIGRVAGARLRPGLRVSVVAHARGQRHRLADVRLREDGTFSLRPRVRAARGVRILRIRAVVPGVGRSPCIRLRLRGR